MKTFDQWVACEAWDGNEVRGEYWIREDGGIEYADGDIGDRNHEMIVLETLRNDIADRLLGVDADRVEQYEWYPHWASKIAEFEAEKTGREFDPEDFDHLYWRALQSAGYNTAAINVSLGNGDARDYALEFWGWKRVARRGVETWNYTPSDMRIIAKGISEIADGEFGGDYNPQEIGMTIYIRSTGKSADTTLAQLESPMAPKPGATANFGMANRAAKAWGDSEDATSAPAFYQKQGDHFGVNRDSKVGEQQPLRANKRPAFPGRKPWAPQSESTNR